MASEPTSVTIVVTTYNHAHFLVDAIESIRAQTVAVDEIIVVDDGSHDDPAQVIDRFSEVRLIRQENQGLAAARNAGLKAAQSTFIGFLDADDRLLPTMVEVNLRQFERKPDCAFVYGAYRYVDPKGNVIYRPPLHAPGRDVYAGFLSGNLVGMHGTVLYRREILLASGGFDPSLPAVEDYDVYLRLSREHAVSAEDEVLADYRQHDANMSNNNAFMMDWALTVQGRHLEMARTRPEWEEAFRRGKAKWKKYYVRQQLSRLKKNVKQGRYLWSDVAGTIGIARRAPMETGRELLASAKSLKDAVQRRKRVNFGDLRRTTPIDRTFGYGRGKPLDRYYVEGFLEANAGDIHGRVLEIGDGTYTRRFGGHRVTQIDVLNRYKGHPETTFVGDLTDGAGLPSDAFDCIVLTQTLHLIFDMTAAVDTLWRVLRPGGVLLVTVPWISQIDRGEWGRDWFWSIAPRGLEKLLNGPFPTEETHVQACGNVLAATAFIYGLAEHELTRKELDQHDPFCPTIVAGRAVKGAAS